MSSDIVLIGSSNGSSNLGDLAMWESAYDVTRRTLPSARVVTDGLQSWVPSVDVEVLPFLYPSLTHLPYGLRLSRRIARKAANSLDRDVAWRRMEQFVLGRPWDDVSAQWLELLDREPNVVFSGAGGITDEFSLHGIVSWSAIARRSMLQGGRVALIGQGVGPVAVRRNISEARKFLDCATLVTTRNEESIAEIAALGASVSATAAPDWALLLPRTAEDDEIATRIAAEASDGEPFIAVSFHHWRASSSSQRSRLLDALLYIARFAKSAGMRVVGLANSISDGVHDDREFMRSLVKRLPQALSDVVRVINEPTTPATAKAILGLSCLVVATRYHPVVFALGEGTPVVPLVFDEYYRQKMVGAISWYGDLFRAYDLTELDPAFMHAVAKLMEPHVRDGIAERTTVLAHGLEAPLRDWLLRR